MGIKRCPYCRSLVEEGALYCRNCGTQLLFPEDENIEEDIPGEKIILDSKEEAEEEKIFEEELRGVKKGNREDQEAEELSEEEKMEIMPSRSRRKRRVEKDLEETEEDEEKLSGGEKEAKTYPEKEEPTFDFPTAELERLTRSVDEGQKKIEDFLEFLREKGGESPVNKDLVQDKKGKEQLNSEVQEKEDLPPWAEAIRDRIETEVSSATDVSPEIPGRYFFGAREETWRKETAEITSVPEDSGLELSQPPWQIDSGVGLPEKPGQQPLPFEAEFEFGTTSWEEEGEEREMMEEIKDSLRAKKMKREFQEEEEESKEMMIEEEKTGLAIEEKVASRPFLSWLKAKIFDLLFVGLLWFIAFVLAARIVAWPFFTLIGVAAYQAGAFFLLLFSGYFFLFRFFIGETLGDRLFSPGD